MQQKTDPENLPQISSVLATIGEPRLSYYRSYFDCKSDTELLGAYFWGQAICAGFQPTLAMYEVVLRNAVHQAASEFSSRGQSVSYPWYDRAEPGSVRITGKTLEKVTEVLCSGSPPVRLATQPTPDAVVASLSFGFWPSVLDGMNQREQPQILTRAFPGHPNSNPRHWGFQSNVAGLIDELKSIQNLRNAVAHHEPIWKPHRLTGQEKHWSQSVASLRGKHDDMLRVMAWCCPASAAAAQHSFATRVFRRICSTNAVRAFKGDPFGAGEMALFEPPAQLLVVAGAGQ